MMMALYAPRWAPVGVVGKDGRRLAIITTETKHSNNQSINQNTFISGMRHRTHTKKTADKKPTSKPRPQI